MSGCRGRRPATAEVMKSDEKSMGIVGGFIGREQSIENMQTNATGNQPTNLLLVLVNLIHTKAHCTGRHKWISATTKGFKRMQK